ncbi:MAG: hypothetical protein KAQ94_00250 [Arcobacteraceae bacterium]|nr:hypothetical protein [Arcobacteraceae bacterium]
MQQKYINSILFLVFFVTSIVTYIIFDNITQSKIDSLKHYNFLNTAKKMQEQTKILIDEKRNATLAIALSLAEDSLFKKALLNNDSSQINLHNFSMKLRKYSDFKNVWFHLITKDGISFSRSWIQKRGDSLIKARLDVAKMIKKPKIMSTISVGKFDMTFKSMVPIFDNSKFIGIFEVITHFNSIAVKLNKKGINPVILVDKKYKKQLTHPFTKIFINDYYVANLNAGKQQLNIIKNKKIEHFLNYKSQYHIEEPSQQLITIFNLPDINGNPMSYCILFKPLSSIDMSKVSQTQTAMVFYMLLFILVIGLILYFMANKKYNKQLQKQQQRNKLILDAQPYIMVLTDGEHIVDSNPAFLNFFNKYNNIEEFVQEHDCICDFFEKYDSDDYIQEKNIQNKNWIDYILNNSDKNIKVVMKKDNTLHHFLVKTAETKSKEESRFIVVVFVDITKEIDTIQDLREKEKLLAQQSKMASMGEMLENIAHQWRQPLSVISTASSGIVMQKEFGTISEEQEIKMLNTITNSAQHLSRTIDDFRNFFKTHKEKTIFSVKDIYKKTVSLLESKFKNREIEVVENIKDVEIYGLDSELIQAIMNILNNARDILETKEKHQRRLIFIDIYPHNKNIIIKIKDNGGGIPNDIINKVFEPYFTTKHKSQGTGIGLYMSEEMISKHMKGNLTVENEEFEYEGESYKGACFTIILPITKEKK